MNIFSGARRIAFIIGVIIALAGIYELATSKPYVTIHYSIPTYAAEAVEAGDCDIFESASRRVTFKTKSGDPIEVELCFLASESRDGRMLVPYAEVDGQVWMNDRYSSDVTRYTERYAAKMFALSDSGIERAEATYSTEYWRTKGRVLGSFGFGLFIFWLSVYAIGWIARGFMGIPRGQDRRIASTTL